jgi:Protein of unknown function (DUF3667)
VGRITFSYIIHEVIHFFTHADNRFLFTSWRMVKKPGLALNEFVNGKRIKYQPPVSYFLIWNAILILVFYIIQKIFGENKGVNFGEYFGPGPTTEFAISHLNIVVASFLYIKSIIILSHLWPCCMGWALYY